MQDFIGDQLPAIQNVILERYVDEKVQDVCVCDRGSKRLFRCADCDTNNLTCADCLVDAHKHNWFHWAEKWNGCFFERLDMSALGLRVYLGHAGECCPHNTSPSVKNLRVAEINGMHACQIVYCKCSWRMDKHLQLIHGTGCSHPLLESQH